MITPITITEEDNLERGYKGVYTYTGEEMTFDDIVLKHRASGEIYTLQLGVDYVFEYDDAINVGTNKLLKVNGIGNFNGRILLRYSITPEGGVVVEGDWTFELLAEDYEYTGSPIEPQFNLYFGYILFEEGYTI